MELDITNVKFYLKKYIGLDFENIKFYPEPNFFKIEFKNRDILLNNLKKKKKSQGAKLFSKKRHFSILA